MFQHILVPLDGSMRAERAIPVAARIARATGGSMILLRVAEPPVEFETFATKQEPEAERGETPVGEAAIYLRRLARSADLQGLAVVVEELVGAPAPTILAYAESSPADLIVLCSHGRSGFTRWALGSVADKILHHASIPVLFLHEHGPTLRRPDAERPLRVLVTLDGSKASEAILEPVIQLVETFAPPAQDRLHLLHVVDTRDIAENFSESVGAQIIEHMQQQANEYLTTLTNRIRSSMAAESELPITCAVVTAQDVAMAIIRAGESLEDAEGHPIAGPYDVIAMSTHGRGALARWIVGSITERVLHTTSQPVFVVRPPHALLHESRTGALLTQDEVESGA